MYLPLYMGYLLLLSQETNLPSVWILFSPTHIINYNYVDPHLNTNNIANSDHDFPGIENFFLLRLISSTTYQNNLIKTDLFKIPFLDNNIIN